MFYAYISNRAFVAVFCLKNIFDQKIIDTNDFKKFYVIKTDRLNVQKVTKYHKVRNRSKRVR